MPILRPSSALRVIKSATSPRIAAQRTLLTLRPLSTTSQLAVADHAHEDRYDPPTGWLFGVKPGEKPEKEGWETVFYWGFFGSFAVAIVGYAFKPDTSIQTWALEEARRRLEAEGILKEPDSDES